MLFCDCFFEVLCQRKPNTAAKISGIRTIRRGGLAVSGGGDDALISPGGGVAKVSSHLVTSCFTLSNNALEQRDYHLL